LYINGNDYANVDANSQDQFEDEGAGCYDGGRNAPASWGCEAGSLGGSVVIRTNMPGTAMPGDYWSVYTCVNSGGVPASPATRHYTVTDRTCPVCRLNAMTGPETVEASFPYSDAGARCTDVIDGDLDVTTWDYGVLKPWAEIVNVEMTGQYMITYRAKDSSDNWNDGTMCKGAQSLVRTITVVDTLKPVVALQYGSAPIQVSKGSSLQKHYVNGVPLIPTGMVHSMDDEALGFHYHASRRLLASLAQASTHHTAGMAALVSALCGFALLALSVLRKHRAGHTGIPL
jgi:hypothetical protein